MRTPFFFFFSNLSWMLCSETVSGRKYGLSSVMHNSIHFDRIHSLSIRSPVCLSLFSFSLMLCFFFPACPPGTFKSTQGPGLCLQCPPNSRSTAEAATICVCRNGYYRGDADQPDQPCTSEFTTWHKRSDSVQPAMGRMHRSTLVFTSIWHNVMGVDVLLELTSTHNRVKPPSAILSSLGCCFCFCFSFQFWSHANVMT